MADQIYLLEELAAQEHESWAGWTRWMLAQIEREAGAEDPRAREGFLEVLNRMACVQRWRRQLEAPYESLSDREKESDRDVVRKKWPLYAKAAQLGPLLRE